MLQLLLTCLLFIQGPGIVTRDQGPFNGIQGQGQFRPSPYSPSGPGRPNMPEGIFDININIDPKLKQYADDVKKEVVDTLYCVGYIGTFALGLLSGILGTMIFMIRRASGSRAGVAAALVVALLFATPAGVWAQEPEPSVDLLTYKLVEKNFGSRLDGSGMCVYNSMNAQMRSQYMHEWDDFARWLAEHYPGGGYPERVTEYVREYARHHRLPVPDYIQVIGHDTIPAIRLALRTGRAVAATDSGDVRFYGQPVPHMTNVVYMDDNVTYVVDNNRPHQLEIIRTADYIRRHRHFDQGWAVIFLEPPVCPRPVNERDERLKSPLRIPDCPDCPQSPYEWKVESYAPNMIQLMRNGSRVGQYDPYSNIYHRLEPIGPNHWRLVPEQPPIQPPQASVRQPYCPTCPNQQAPVQRPVIPTHLTGVDYSHFPTLAKGRTLYASGGNSIGATVATRLMLEKALTDDTQKARIVLHGREATAETMRLLNEDERFKSIMQQYPAAYVYSDDNVGYEQLERLGYGEGVTVLGPMVDGVSEEIAYFQAPPSGGQLAEAIVRADPTYRPGLNSKGEFDVGPVAIVFGTVVILAVVLVALLSIRRTR